MNIPLKIGINGFGRIGRAAFKVLLDTPELEMVRQAFSWIDNS